MADEMKFSVLIQLVDRISDKLKSIGGGIGDLARRAGESSGRLGALGERMVAFGQKLSLTTALVSEGADTLHEWTDALSEPAMAMEHSLATMGAMTGLAGKDLAAIRAHAVAFADTHPGATAEQWAHGFTRLRGVYQDTAKAMRAEDVAAQLGRFGVDQQSALQVLSSTYASMGASAKTTGDQVLRMMQLYGPDNAQQLAMVIGRLGGVAATTNTPLSQLLALAGHAGQIMPGRGMMMFTSTIMELQQAASKGKANIDFSHGLLAGLMQLRGQLAGMGGAEKIDALRAMGITATGSTLSPFLNSLDQITAKQHLIENSAGALGKAYTQATGNAVDQVKLLHQNVDNLFDAFDSPALATVNRWLGDFTSLTQSAAGATEHHSTIARYAAVSLTGLDGATYYGFHALSSIGAMSVFAGQGIEVFSKLAGQRPRIMAFGHALLNTIPTIVSFGAALLTNPLTWYIAGAVALGLVAYEIYEHWGQLGEWFSSMWARLKSIFAGFGAWIPGWAKGFGHALLVGLTGPFGMIAAEIYKHWDAIKASCEKIAGGIKGFFVGHSPPPFGPLRDLGHVTIAETIADRIRPAPILAAVTRTAAAVALAAPLMVAPAAAGAGAVAGAPGAAPIIHYALVINGSGLSHNELPRALETHAYELRRILSREDARRERTELK